MEKKKKLLNKTKINVFLDLALAMVVIVEMEEHFTGLPLHEVLGLIFGAALIIHILLHWDWVVSITLGFFKQILHESRLNYVLNLALLVDLVVVVVTGIGISRTLSLNLDVPHSWESIHVMAAELILVLVGLHVAMHWKWIATNVAKYLVPRIPIKRQAKSNLVSSEVKNGTA